VLHPEARPKVWKRTPQGYDRDRMGLEIESFDQLPAGELADWQRREYFDTSKFGKSAAGHDFPAKLSEDERQAVLEYLKTL
jgi:hypothetical protein